MEFKGTTTVNWEDCKVHIAVRQKGLRKRFKLEKGKQYGSESREESRLEHKVDNQSSHKVSYIF